MKTTLLLDAETSRLVECVAKALELTLRALRMVFP